MSSPRFPAGTRLDAYSALVVVGGKLCIVQQVDDAGDAIAKYFNGAHAYAEKLAQELAPFLGAEGGDEDDRLMTEVARTSAALVAALHAVDRRAELLDGVTCPLSATRGAVPS